MKRITLRERERLPYGGNGELTEKEAFAFANIKPSVPNSVLTWKDKAIWFGPFCGVLRAGDVMVELLPKAGFGYDTEEDARGLLVGLLRAAGKFRPAKSGHALLGQQKMHLLDIFILDFCIEVQVALQRGAIFRYAERAESLSALRGRLQLTEHLRRNAFDQSKLYCRFDDRMVDNIFNRTLKAVLRMLLVWSIGARAKSAVAALLHRFDEVGHHPRVAETIEDLMFDRTNKHWRPVFQQAEWLAKGLFPDLRLGSVQGSSLIFNMERLFEKVLGDRLVRESRGDRLQIQLQGSQKFLAKSMNSQSRSNIFGLRPDIAVWDGEQIVSILDAKWKELDKSSPHLGVSSGDIYQMTAYSSRYRCSRLALVFPATKDCPPGFIESFNLQIPEPACIDVVAVDLWDLASPIGMPRGLEALVRPESRSRQPHTVGHEHSLQDA